jgi:PAS domain S-box-containing protein
VRAVPDPRQNVPVPGLPTDDRPYLVLADGGARAAGALLQPLAAAYEVGVVRDPATALASLRARPPDLLLVPLKTPILDGLELLRALRREPRLEFTPVILLLGERAGEDAVVDGAAAGADDYLIEPFGDRELLARVANQLRVGRLRRDTAAHQQRLAAIFAQAAVGIGEADLDGRHLMVNQRYCELVGRPLDEVLRLRLQDLTHPDDVAANLAAWRHMIATGESFVIEKRYQRPDGSVAWVNNRVSLLRAEDGTPHAAIAVVIDVTERKRAEDALRQLTGSLEQRVAERTEALAAANRQLMSQIDGRLQAQAALRREREFSGLVIESSSEGVIAIDTALRHTLWNAAAEAMTGLPRASVLGRTMTEIFPKIAGSPVEAAWLNALAGRTSALQDRTFSIVQTGRSGIYDASFAPLRDADGAIVGALSLLRDITAQRRAEEALRQAQKMEAVGQLTGGVAHDFNNLLTVIAGNIETLQRRLPEESKLHRLTEAALRGTDRAATLTHRLLAFSRRQPLDPKPVDPNKLVAGLSELLRRTLGETIAVETVVGAGSWRICCDPNQLDSALLNLAVNARDAMPDGGKLTIETANSYVDEAYAAAQVEMAPGQYVVIAVTDTGTGMAPEVVEKAFEPFFTTKGVGRGTGLGLSQVYGFVKQSGGNVKIYSEPGRGTTIKLYLPRLPDAAAEAEPAPAAAPAPAGTRHETILVVEDDEDVRHFSVEQLRELGYDVLEAPDGPSALALVERHPEILLLFTDVALPGGLDGKQLAAAAQRQRPQLKILFTTGYARNAIVHHGALEPNVELIVKPFTYASLAGKIRQVLGG